MYGTIKQLAKTLFSEKWLRHNQESLRPLVAKFYKGNTYQCNICNFKMSRFIHLNDGKKLCPNCGSLARTRRLYKSLEGKLSHKKVLHFSPPRSLMSALSVNKSCVYETSDYMGEFEAMHQFNIESISAANDSYDLIICYHVLEHINNDTQAMQELYRILKPGGSVYIQTPFKAGDIYEDDSIVSAEERLLHFGQEDHLRMYSVEGLKQRLQAVGFQVTVNTFKETVDNINGFSEEEQQLIAVK